MDWGRWEDEGRKEDMRTSTRPAKRKTMIGKKTSENGEPFFLRNEVETGVSCL